ncbi:MAG: hypothetical protein JEY79_19200 [Pseudodesulfovibrio sp.]|nr:hypothetical protein [Pseudodesulfovibrio sp.]
MKDVAKSLSNVFKTQIKDQSQWRQGKAGHNGGVWTKEPGRSYLETRYNRTDLDSILGDPNHIFKKTTCDLEEKHKVEIAQGKLSDEELRAIYTERELSLLSYVCKLLVMVEKAGQMNALGIVFNKISGGPRGKKWAVTYLEILAISEFFLRITQIKREVAATAIREKNTNWEKFDSDLEKVKTKIKNIFKPHIQKESSLWDVLSDAFEIIDGLANEVKPETPAASWEHSLEYGILSDVTDMRTGRLQVTGNNPATNTVKYLVCFFIIADFKVNSITTLTEYVKKSFTFIEKDPPSNSTIRDCIQRMKTLDHESLKRSIIERFHSFPISTPWQE